MEREIFCYMILNSFKVASQARVLMDDCYSLCTPGAPNSEAFGSPSTTPTWLYELI